MEAWQRIKARISQLFEPTLWELEIFALRDGIKRRDKALAQGEAKYWDEVKRGNQASAELEAVKAENKRLSGMYGLEYAQKVTAELDAVKAERDEAREKHGAALHDAQGFRDDYERTKAELAARTQPVKVKVRWDVTEYDVSRKVYGLAEGECVSGIRGVMNYLATHAVIDVPPGVPSVEELIEIGESAYDNEVCHPDCDRARVIAIRDAVIAGMGQESTVAPIPETLARVAYREIKAAKLFSASGYEWTFEDLIPEYQTALKCLGIAVWNEGRPTPAPDWIDDQIEQLALVLREAHAEYFNSEANAYCLDSFMIYARAAVEFMRQTNQPVEVANAK